MQPIVENPTAIKEQFLELNSKLEKIRTQAIIELPHHNNLQGAEVGMYVRYDSSCPNQHWGKENTVNMAKLVASSWRRAGNTPVVHIGDLSAQNLQQTGCHQAHKLGTNVDMDLPGCLPADGNYTPQNQDLCAQLLYLSITCGVKRALFSDEEVAEAVNNLARERGFDGRVEVRSDHNNHFHLEM